MRLCLLSLNRRVAFIIRHTLQANIDAFALPSHHSKVPGRFYQNLVSSFSTSLTLHSNEREKREKKKKKEKKRGMRFRKR